MHSGNDFGEPRVDLFVFTALTEEAQVVTAVLDQVADLKDQKEWVRFYNYTVVGGRCCRIATASAHHLGAIGMGIFAAPLLSKWRPKSAALVGIAAAVDASAVALGDVPVASHVIGFDDISVQDGVLTFRSEGFQVDPDMRAGAGELRVTTENYLPWQDACRGVLKGVIKTLAQLRRTQIRQPRIILRPHLIVEIVGGGPFLLRDRDFRDALRSHLDISSHKSVNAHPSIGVSSPVHPKLVSAEMESHGFMRAANTCGIPATVLKGISDIGDADKATLESTSGGFFRAYSCSNAMLAALHILARRVVAETTSAVLVPGVGTSHLSEYERRFQILGHLRSAGLSDEHYQEGVRKLIDQLTIVHGRNNESR